MAIEPVDPTPAPADPATEPEASLAEHEAQFGDPQTRPGPDPEPEPEEDSRRPPRDDTGKFTKQPRHRAKSQQASPEDVPRIAELTRRLRETEAERDALKTRSAPVAPPVVESPPVEPTHVAAQKPKIEDFQTYEAYNEAVIDWKVADARRQDRETAQKDAEAAQLTQSWRSRVDAAKAKYPDFEQVALLAPTTIPQGSLIDYWILEHKAGADVLYSLQQQPQEVSRLLALPLLDQVEALSLLAQRLGSPTREPAVKTGAAATPVQKVAPRPPTPVRTSAVPASDEPPGDDASLSAHEQYYHPQR